MLLTVVLVVAFRESQSARAVIYRFFTSVDRLALWAASAATAQVFPGDRGRRWGISITDFFDTVLVIATGIQCGLVGLLARLLVGLRSAILKL